jgi:hypothetical protein
MKRAAGSMRARLMVYSSGFGLGLWVSAVNGGLTRGF